jgi:hypothetical protein
MPTDEKTTFEIALRDSISPGLRSISRELKKLNALRQDSDQSGTGTVDKFHRSTSSLGSVARSTVRELEGVGSWVVGVGGGLLGGLGAIKTIEALATSFSNMAQARVQLTMFSRDTRFAVEDIDKLRGAMSRMGMSADRADTMVTGLSTKLQELQAFKEGSPLFQQLAKMGSGGVSLANELINEKDYMKSLHRISEVFKRQGPEAQAYMVSVLGIPASVLENLDANIKKVRDAPDVDPKVAQQFLDNQIAVRERIEGEWTIFGEHALGRINEIYERLQRYSGDAEGHPIAGWASKLFDNLITESDIEQAKAALKLMDDLKKLNERLRPDEVKKSLQGAFAPFGVGGQRSRWDEDFDAFQKKEDNKLLEDIGTQLKKLFTGDGKGGEGGGGGFGFISPAAASTMPGGAGTAYPGDTSGGQGQVPRSMDSGPPAPGATPGDVNANRPYKIGGKVTLGGEEFDWESGGTKRGSIPYGTHDVNIGKGDIGPIGQRIGSVATVGRPGGEIDDPKYPGRPRLGVQIHPGSGDTLDQMYTEGCFSISRSQWPKFKAALLRESATHGPLTLTINPDGKASFQPKAAAQQQTTARPAETSGEVGSDRPVRVDNSVEGRKAALQVATNEMRKAGLTITSEYRSPEHPLSRANPHSAHSQGLAFDTRAHTTAESDAAQATIRATMAARGLQEGRDYKIIDEVRHPSGWATGPHVHTQFTPEGSARFARAASKNKEADDAAPIDKARENVDKDNDVWKKGSNAVKFSFNNVPHGVKTNAEASGSFTHVEVSRKSAMAERAPD